MKSVCSIHEQAYDVGEHCPYCVEPEAQPEMVTVDVPTGFGSGLGAWLPARQYIGIMRFDGQAALNAEQASQAQQIGQGVSWSLGDA